MNENSGETQEPKPGDIYISALDEFYIVGKINNNGDLVLINLHTGNRFSDVSIFGESNIKFKKVHCSITIYPNAK